MLCLRDEIPQESIVMSRFQVLHKGVKLLHSIISVAGENTLCNQLRSTESDIEEVYVLNKRLKLMSLEKISLYKKIEELKTYREALSDLIYERRWQNAIQTELESLQSHGVWKLNKLLKG